jgi:hypothetical protein
MRRIKMAIAENCVRPEQADKKTFNLSGHEVEVQIAPIGMRIDVSEDYDIRSLRGPAQFDVVVRMGKMMIDRGMSGGVVPEGQRFKSTSDLPENVKVQEFNSEFGPEIAKAAEAIRELANGYDGFGWLIPSQIKKYFEQDSIIAKHQLPPDTKKYKKVAIMRAGMTALQAAGIAPEDQLPIDEKRLNDKKDPNILAFGIRVSKETLEELQGENVFIRERAIATFGSLIALNYTLLAKGIKPKEIYWSGTVANQMGMELGLEHRDQMKQYGIDIVIDAGRVDPIFSGPPHPFYIIHIDENGKLSYSVGDGGDWGDLKLPKEHRCCWPGEITQEHIDRLALINPELVNMVKVGDDVEVDYVEKIWNKANELGANPLAVGIALTHTDVPEEVFNKYNKTHIDG